jgi:hypothetical protein
MIGFLISVWVALIGAERIDFLDGGGSFVLTPFLILSPLIILIGLVCVIYRDSNSRWSFNLSAAIIPFVLSVLAFLILNLAATIFGLDVTLGARRFILLMLILVYSSTIFLLLGKSINPTRALVHGAYVGLAVYFLFSAAELVNWLTGMFTNMPVINLVSATIGPFVPRVSGMSLDPNRGGMLIVVYTFIIIRFAGRSKIRTTCFWLAAVMLLLTLSKTALIAAAVMLLVLSFQNPGWAVRNRRTIFNLAIGLAIISFLIFHSVDIGGADAPFNLEEAIAERLAVSEEKSGGIHLALLMRGFEVAFSSMKNLLVGIGFGASHAVLNDFFPGNKYANFHCGYISVMVESGILSLGLFLFLYFYPVFRRKSYLPLILAIASFNLFYQLTLDPFFWFCMLLFWNNFGVTRRNRST